MRAFQYSLRPLTLKVAPEIHEAARLLSETQREPQSVILRRALRIGLAHIATEGDPLMPNVSPAQQRS